jgi:DNA-binding NarL/FixJ family response regulator
MTKILLADDHAILRKGLRELLTREFRDLEIGEAHDSEQALVAVQGNPWDLMILDITMPGRSGLDILRDVKGLQPDLPVLILTVYSEEQLGKRALKAGASGFMTKDSSPEELTKAIRKLLGGGMYVSPALAEIIALNLSKDSDAPLHEKLSNRELEVLRLMASGKTLTQIAETLHLGVTTVSTYRAHLLEKLDLETTADLIHYALQNNLTM